MGRIVVMANPVSHQFLKQALALLRTA